MRPRQRQIVSHRAGQDEALAFAIFRHQGETGGQGIARATDAGGFAIHQNLAAVQRIKAEQRAGQFGAAGPDESREAQDFAVTQFEAHVAHLRVPQIPDGQRDGARFPRRTRVVRFEIATDHQADQLALIQFRGGLRADGAAIPQDRDAVGEPLDFLQAMRDVDDAHALAGQSAQLDEQGLGLRLRERGGRLVENENPRAGGERPGDFDHLLLRDAQVRDAGLRRADFRQTQIRDERLRVGEKLPAIQKAETPRLAPEEDVFSHGKIRGEREFLMNQPDAEPVRVASPARISHGLAVHQDFARIRLVNAAENFDQRGFARAVLTEQRVNLPGPQLEIHPRQRRHAAETFADAAQFDQGGCVGSGGVHRSLTVVLPRCPVCVAITVRWASSISVHRLRATLISAVPPLAKSESEVLLGSRLMGNGRYVSPSAAKTSRLVRSA